MSEDRLYTELAQVLETWRHNGKPWPQDMPQEIRYAVPWWIEHQKPADRTERPRQVLGRSNDDARMVFPYVERLVYTLRKFLRQDTQFQTLILSAWEDGIDWRGEDEWIFLRHLKSLERRRS
jgi:hypothetical protein